MESIIEKLEFAVNYNANVIITSLKLKIFQAKIHEINFTEGKIYLMNFPIRVQKVQCTLIT